MKPGLVTIIAVAIVLFCIGVSGLLPILQGQKFVETDQLIEGLGIGCMFAAVWFLIMGILNTITAKRG